MNDDQVMSEKKKIAVRTCGGCFCKFDRRKIIDDLKNSFQDSCEFSFSYDKANDGDFDLVLLINGCDSECAEASEITENLIIDHTNWERAEEVFAGKIGLDTAEEGIIKAFHMMWDNYPEQVRLIDRSFRVVAGNPSYIDGGGQTEVKCNVGDPELHRKCQAIASLNSRETKVVTNEIAGMEFEAYWVPVEGAPDYFVHFNNGLNAIIERLSEK